MLRLCAVRVAIAPIRLTFQRAYGGTGWHMNQLTQRFMVDTTRRVVLGTRLLSTTPTTTTATTTTTTAELPKIRPAGKKARKLLQTQDLQFNPFLAQVSVATPGIQPNPTSTSAAEATQQRQQQLVQQQLLQHQANKSKACTIQRYLAQTLQVGYLIEFNRKLATTVDVPTTHAPSAFASDTHMLGIITQIHRASSSSNDTIDDGVRSSRRPGSKVPMVEHNISMAAAAAGAAATAIEHVIVVGSDFQEYHVPSNNISFIFSSSVINKVNANSSTFNASYTNLLTEIHQRCEHYNNTMPHEVLRKFWKYWRKQSSRIVAPQDLHAFRQALKSDDSINVCIATAMKKRQISRNDYLQTGSTVEQPWRRSLDHYASIVLLRNTDMYFKSRGFGQFACRTRSQPSKDIDEAEINFFSTCMYAIYLPCTRSCY
jgi:hypothetical protein